MKKTQHIIVIKAKHPKGWDDFFSRLFWKEPEMIHPATKVYELIKSGEFNEKSRESVMKEVGMTYGQYYYLLSCLKSLGLIRRDADGYQLSSDFAERLRRLIEYVTE